MFESLSVWGTKSAHWNVDHVTTGTMPTSGSDEMSTGSPSRNNRACTQDCPSLTPALVMPYTAPSPTSCSSVKAKMTRKGTVSMYGECPRSSSLQGEMSLLCHGPDSMAPAMPRAHIAGVSMECATCLSPHSWHNECSVQNLCADMSALQQQALTVLALH